MKSKSFSTDTDQLEDLADYRPLSFLAYVAILLALPGALTMFHIAFLIFPVIALGVAFVAWRQSAHSSYSYASLRPAQIAVFVSIFLVCFGIATRRLNEQREFNFAIGSVQTWLDLLRGGNPHEAYLLTMPPNTRPVELGENVINLRQVGSSFVKIESEQEFLAKPVNMTLADPTNQVQIIGYVRQVSPDGRILYRFVCQVSNPMQSLPGRRVTIDFQSAFAVGGTVDWQIGNRQLFE
jgi:hypothetical protein